MEFIQGKLDAPISRYSVIMRLVKKYLSLNVLIAVILIVSLILGVATSVILNQREVANIAHALTTNRLDIVTKNMSEDLFVPLAQSSSVEFDTLPILLRLDAFESIVVSVVLDVNGNVISSYAGNNYSEETASTLIEAVSGGNALLPSELPDDIIFSANIIGEPEQPLGKIVVFESVSATIINSQSRLISGILPPMIALLFSMVVVALYIVYRTMKPLNKLANFTLRTTESDDFSSRFEPTGTPEINELGININALLQHIQDKFAENSIQHGMLTEQRNELEKVANTDSLTGLANRQFVTLTLSEELLQAKRCGTDFSILYFDLDGFKHVNDALGHEIGDKLLVVVTKMIRIHLRDEDLFARVGGDEFLIRLGGAHSSTMTEKISLRLVDLFKKPCVVDYYKLNIGVSVGVAKASEAQYDLLKLLRNADMAMYSAKDSGKGKACYFDPSMAIAAKRKLKIGAELQIALQNKSLNMAYQPRFNQLGEIASLEALSRWNHPKLGIISPDEFIQVAEQTGMMSKLTESVIDRVIDDLPIIINKFGKATRVSLNISTVDLIQPNFLDLLERKLTTPGVDCKNIELEITETAYLHNIKHARDFCELVRSLGGAVALDDFGTGYSSLNYLAKIPVTTLKIDRSFVNELFKSNSANLVVKAIIKLGHQLNLQICAEGVETNEQLTFLTKNGCDETQGFLQCRPEPLDIILNRY